LVGHVDQRQEVLKRSVGAGGVAGRVEVLEQAADDGEDGASTV
jgi:hypothetical protein